MFKKKSFKIKIYQKHDFVLQYRCANKEQNHILQFNLDLKILLLLLGFFHEDHIMNVN